MFGKPRDIDDTDLLDSSAIDGFFGDEAAAANALEVHELQHRVEQVEAQISSQFTSLATYAQIARNRSSSPGQRPKPPPNAPNSASPPSSSATRRPDLVVHRSGPCRLDARRHRPPRCTRALRRPDPQGPRRLPGASEGARRRHHHDVRTSRAGPAGLRPGRRTGTTGCARRLVAPPSLVGPTGAPTTIVRRSPRSAARSPICHSTADQRSSPERPQSVGIAAVDRSQRTADRFSGRSRRACPCRPTWDRSASG